MQRTGGWILATGAALGLIVKTFWLVTSFGVMTPAYKFINFAFGNWLASLVAPRSLDGYDMSFEVVSLLWIPWAAIVIGYLLWGAFRTIQGRASQRLHTIMLVIGVWMAVGFLYEKIFWRLSYFSGDLSFLLVGLLSDLAAVAMIIGIGIIFSQRNKQRKETSNEGVVMEGQNAGQTMTLSQILFSFEGRINRAKYWGYSVLLILVVCIGLGLDMVTTGELGVFYIITAVATIWPSIAIAVKRCHDRDRSGWFVLVSLIPLVSIWYLIEVGFLRGTSGSNQYGPDPLAPSSSPEPVPTE